MTHPNIIRLLDIRAPKLNLGMNSSNTDEIGRAILDGCFDELQLVFECADCDLFNFVRSRKRQSNPIKLHEIKSILYQTLKALKYVHSSNIIHRGHNHD